MPYSFHRKRHQTRTAFTLVELLVVIAIIGVLVALLLPAVQAAREAARRAECQNKMRQWGLACQNYHDVFKELPAAYSGVTLGSWLSQVLPYVEQESLRDLINQEVPWYSRSNKTARETPLTLAQCPSAGDGLPAFIGGVGGATLTIEDPSPLRSHYVGNMGAEKFCPMSGRTRYPATTYTMGACGDPGNGGWSDNGLIYPQSEVNFKEVEDGLTNTILFGEVSSIRSGPARIWICGVSEAGSLWIYNSKNTQYPINVAFRANSLDSSEQSEYGNNDTSFSSEHPGGAHVCMADASVHFLSEDTDLEGVLLPMASRASGEIYESPF